MFERFTEKARQVVVLAQDEARALNHNYIGTEHILLGLLRERDGLAAGVLKTLDITLEETRAQVARIVGPGEELTIGQIPFTPRAKKVLELSLREALGLGHNYIGTEHLLLAIVRENDGVAARILLDFDVDAEKIRDEIIRMLGGPAATSIGGVEALRAEQDEAAAAEANPELASELKRVRGERKAAFEAKEFGRAAELRAEERRLRRQLLGLPEVDPWKIPQGGLTLESDVMALSPSGRRFRSLRRRPVGYAIGQTITPDGQTIALILLGWVLFGTALGIGVFLGWLIWG